MQFNNISIPGCYEILPKLHEDERGSFIKTYHRDTFEQHGLPTNWAEQFYSISKAWVLRGLHFQMPPHDHAKLVYCISGKVMDVVVDLRKGSPTYGEHACVILGADTGNMLYMPSGIAHGFCTYDAPATMMYHVTTVHNPKGDTGIRWDSAGIEWPHPTPHLSERDKSFSSLDEFDTPFVYQK